MVPFLRLNLKRGIVLLPDTMTALLTLSPFFGQIWGLLKVDLRPAVRNHVSGFYTELPSFP